MVGDRCECSEAGGEGVKWIGVVNIFTMSRRLKETTYRNLAENSGEELWKLTNASTLLPISRAVNSPQRWRSHEMLLLGASSMMVFHRGRFKRGLKIIMAVAWDHFEDSWSQLKGILRNGFGWGMHMMSIDPIAKNSFQGGWCRRGAAYLPGFCLSFFQLKPKWKFLLCK